MGVGKKRRRLKTEVKNYGREKFSNVPMRKEMETAREHLMGTLSFSFSKEEHGCFLFLAFLRRYFHLLIAPLGFNQT